jgi:hypothetical protein
MTEGERSQEERDAARRAREAARRQRAGVAEEPFDDTADGAALDHAALDHATPDDAAPDEPLLDDPVLDAPGAASSEAPSGTRRISRLEQRAIRPQTPRTVRRRVPHSRRRGRWRGRIGALVVLVLAAALIWFLVELFQPLGT